MLVVSGIGGSVFFLAIQFLQVEASPYIGMLALTGLPMLLIMGLIIVPAGMLWEARRRAVAARRGEGVPPALQLDFGNPRHLVGMTAFAGITAVIVGVLGATGYRAVEFMETPAFCGGLCHTVMEPQYEPYKRSAHAEVHCTDCHIGPGANWYVQSKLSGLLQMIAVATDSYPRPVPAPIEHLRPARATCEGCHWREKVYGMFLKVYRTYLPDEENTLHMRALAFRVGTGGGELEDAGGVHWHTSARLWYQTADEGRQIMGWVQVEKPEGIDVWVNPEAPSREELREERLMDCIDCHNRAAHKIPTPYDLIDEALAAGRMDSSLPYLKQEASWLLGGYASVPDPGELATRWSEPGWFEQLEEFYETNYPELAVSKRESIQDAIDEMKRITELVLYPDMKTNWLTYADNRGHVGEVGTNPGCFRCHGTLVNLETGRELPGGLGGTGCLTCHALGEEAEEQLGGGPIEDPACQYCHVRIPLEDLERPLVP
jgi:nitrate/TMAO reductase-like tetraheme cytochrome c subunit